MSRYRRFNPKRRLAPAGEVSEERLNELSRTVVYTGSPLHKRNPGDFGIDRPQPRSDRSLCDSASIFKKSDALKYLRAGIKRGAVSEKFGNGWPQIVWAVTGSGTVLEARRDGEGSYHGYPLQRWDPVVEKIKKFWGSA